MAGMTRIPRYIYLITVVLCSFSAMPLHAIDGMSDQVIVKKSERKLYLMSGDDVMRTYDIALGLVPEGDKEREGDFKTPEGEYLLTDRLVDSLFFLAIQVSYPDVNDVEGARKLGVRPGGRIMIHGQPNEPKHSAKFYEMNDWTNGCIAVSNSAMIEIWQLTNENTPVMIEP
jgi:murein L,D-transpeptidase YafK